MAWDNFIDELKLQVNIVDVIGREVNLKKAGANYKGLCPFHSEKTPSFMVNEEKQIFNCFGCGQKGDVIKFVQTYYNLPFMDAVEKLAGEYGITMPERHHSGPKIDYEKYYSINAKAARFYFKNLSAGHNKGLAYFRKRGLSDDTITKFGLGYAPASGTALVDYLRSENIADEDMLKLGLVNKGKSGLYDKFRDRAMFPIINTQDKVIGFGGRAIGDYKPKYLNSPESEIFLKKNNLFGINLTRNSISSQDRAIIVEGYMDVISLYQSGVTNVAASLGTALTDNQAKLLCRYSKNIVLSYDSDQAGISAALRGITVITGAGGKPKVLTVSDGKDPDEFVQKHGKDDFIKLADNAVPATDFRLKLARRGFDLSNDRDVLDYIEQIVPILKTLGPVECNMYVRKLSSEFGISEQAINMAVQTEDNPRRNLRQSSSNQNIQRRTNRKNTNQKVLDSNTTEARIEMTFIILALNNTRYLKRFKTDDIKFESELASKIMSVCMSYSDSLEAGTHRIEMSDISDKLDPEDDALFKGFLNTIQIGPDDEVVYKETLSSYRINQYRSKKSEIQNDIAIAEKVGRFDEADRLALRLIEIDGLIKKTLEEKNA